MFVWCHLHQDVDAAPKLASDFDQPKQTGPSISSRHIRVALATAIPAAATLDGMLQVDELASKANVAAVKKCRQEQSMALQGNSRAVDDGEHIRMEIGSLYSQESNEWFTGAAAELSAQFLETDVSDQQWFHGNPNETDHQLVHENPLALQQHTSVHQLDVSSLPIFCCSLFQTDRKFHQRWQQARNHVFWICLTMKGIRLELIHQ